MTVGRMHITLGEHGGPRKTRQDSSSLGSCPATETLSRLRGAAQAALRLSRVVSDVVRAYGLAGGHFG